MKLIMLIVRIMGGLGNQMFQYAVGRHLSILNGQELRIDVSSYEGVSPDPLRGLRSFGLSHFNIAGIPATKEDLHRFRHILGNDWSARFWKKLDGLRSYYKRQYIVEPVADYMRFQSNLLTTKLPHDVYLRGFWTSEKYFVDIEDTIRKELSFIDEPDAYNRSIALEVGSCESVAAHIRRGDYASGYAKNFAMLSVQYYKHAADMIASRVTSPVFYVFSDDPSWAEKHVKFNFPTKYISHNGDEKNYEDLRLMSKCHHHIIANSTFSWWGAWLAKSAKQIVIAPKTYYVDSDISDTDYIPSTWHLL